MANVQGFDLDEKTIKTFDAILTAIANDPDLGEEFGKLQFIQTLAGEYDRTDGPIEQMFQKVTQLERAFNNMLTEHTKAQMDMKRAVADMTEATRTIRQASIAQTAEEKNNALKKLEGIEFRQSSYTWNQK